ncbi:MAG: sporulation and cell division repeat protein, partial [Gammaproteobacteria bacterium]|nr:sporulation and cell division repeat protein [Gammaproteobacteria bacterium]
TVVVLGILGWQLYGLIAGDRVTSPPVRTAPIKPSMNGIAQPNQPMPATNIAMPQAAMQPAPTVSNQDKQRLREISQSDTEYLKLIQEYQLLQVQRRIAEDTRAIAVAKLETVKALAETSKFGGPGLGSNSMAIGSMDSDYKLVFTGQEAGQWTATLKMNDQLMDVVTGTNLPDGYKVMVVAGDSVTLQKADKQKVVSFLGVSESSVTEQAENSPATKQAKADALLQIIAPEQVKKKQSELAVPKPEVKTPWVPVTQTDTPKPVEQPLAKAIMPVVINEPAKPVHSELADNQVHAATKIDKNALTAAFLGQDETTILPPVKQAVTSNESMAVKPVAQPAEPMAVTANSQAVVEEQTEVQQAKPANSTIAVLAAKPEPIKSAAIVKPQVKTIVATEKAVSTSVDGFTIQLMSDRDEAAVKAFIKANNLAGKANYFQSFSQGQKRYVLTYGQYASYKEAKTALQALPKIVRGWQPFVRKLEDLKKVTQTKEVSVAKQVAKQYLQPVANQSAKVKIDVAQEPNEIFY